MVIGRSSIADTDYANKVLQEKEADIRPCLACNQGCILGGNLIPAGTHGFKEEVQRLNQWYQRELKKYPIDVHMNEEAGPEKVKEMGADAVILAVGSSAVVPPIRGVESKCCMSCTEALDNVKPVGDKVVIVGGGLVGCEMALEYLQEGKKVTIVEALDHILSAGAPVSLQNVQMLKEAFEYDQAEILEAYEVAHSI